MISSRLNLVVSKSKGKFSSGVGAYVRILQEGSINRNDGRLGRLSVRRVVGMIGYY